MRQILQPAQISCGLWYCMGVEGDRENPENKKEKRYKKMTAIIVTSILASAAVIVTLIATR